MKKRQTIRIAQSCDKDPERAVGELYEGVWQQDIELLVFFCSSSYDRDALAREIRLRFPGVQTAGCTTAGEIGPLGYSENSLVGVSFSAGICRAAVGHLADLQRFNDAQGYAFAQDMLLCLQDKAPQASHNNSFGLLLIDGLSVREEPVTRIFQNALGKIPLIGGSAADALTFAKTHVFFDGRFHTDGAILIILTTSLPFRIFKTQHFAPTEERMVVTAADAACRIVTEINGLPAAQEYARLAGVGVSELTPMRFAASPVVILIDGSYYVRSIRCANPDGSLTFYCAIEEGLVLRVANGVDLLENLRLAFAKIHSQIGRPQLVLGCDCILRKLEVLQNGMTGPVGEIFGYNHTVGFNTYGEQFYGVHVNQTFVGIAMAYSEPEQLDG